MQNYINKYYSYVQIYTENFNILNRVEVAFIVSEFNIRKRRSDGLSVYTREMSLLLLLLLFTIQWKKSDCRDQSFVLTPVHYESV